MVDPHWPSDFSVNFMQETSPSPSETWRVWCIWTCNTTNFQVSFPIFWDGQCPLTIWFFVQFYAGAIPESLGNLVKLQYLCLNNSQLSGQFFFFRDGQCRLTIWSSPCFYLLLPQEPFPSPWETLWIWGNWSFLTTNSKVFFFSFFGVVSADWPSDFPFNFTQGTSLNPWGTWLIWRGCTWMITNYQVDFFCIWGMVAPDWPSNFSFNVVQEPPPSPWETL